MNRWRMRQKWVRKWRYGWLLLITCLLLIFGQYAAGAYGAGEAYSAGEAAYESVDSKADLFTAALGVNDYLDQGQALYDAGQFTAAIATWEKALILAKNQPQQQAIVHNYLAIGYQGLSQWAAADEQIQTGLTLLDLPRADHKKDPRTEQDSAFVTAQLLNTQGSNQLQIGQAAVALDTWQTAIDLYQRFSPVERALPLARTRLNQAQALRVLGFYRRAQTTLTAVRTDLTNFPTSATKLSVLQSLGQILLRTGDLNQAQAVLSEALALASTPVQQAAVQLNLAQTTAALGDTQAALSLYQRAQSQGVPAIQLEASLSQLALQLEASEDPAFSWSAIAQSLDQIFPQLSVLPPSRWGINAQVYLANLLIDNVGIQRLEDLNISAEAIGQQLAQAISQARSLQDRQAEAAALKELGHLYEKTQQWETALDLTQQALNLTYSSSTSYTSAQQQWQLGRILKAQGLLDQSRSAYGNAVGQLDLLQNDIVALNPDAKFSFRDRIEPVYRAYVESLLTGIEQQPDAVRQQRLQQARDTMEALQLAELQNYFRETCLTYQAREIEAIDPHAAVVYSIVINNRLEVITSLPYQLLTYHSVNLEAIDQDALLRDVLTSLHPLSPIDAVVPLGQQLYDWLIAPIATQLEQQAIETLVFVPDGFLRDIPMAILHDGSGYLLERYSLALTPSLKLFNSRPLDIRSSKLLAAGLTLPRQGFSALPGVDQEISQINQLVSTDTLINDRFTKNNVAKEFENNKFSVVHLATHGQFSASADSTFLLTWDGRINVKDLSDLFQTSQDREAPIELLVLSACQTAQGDRRATLGMAGVAVESGARSTVATLWRVQDTSTSMLMGEFYRLLIDTQQPRAKTLRDAQLMLMQNPTYQHPYYWAPFVMIGNWQ
ncbi:MAG: CHAT domain-containing protein [Phormidesmis sp.]